MSKRAAAQVRVRAELAAGQSNQRPSAAGGTSRASAAVKRPSRARATMRWSMSVPRTSMRAAGTASAATAASV